MEHWVKSPDSKHFYSWALQKYNLDTKRNYNCLKYSLQID